MVFMIFVGANLYGKFAHYLFGQVCGKSDKNPSHPKNLLAPALALHVGLGQHVSDRRSRISLKETDLQTTGTEPLTS